MGTPQLAIVYDEQSNLDSHEQVEHIRWQRAVEWQCLAGWPRHQHFWDWRGKGLISLNMAEHSNINFMGLVMSVDSTLCNIGVGLMLASGKNSVALYCHCILVNKAIVQVVFTVWPVLVISRKISWGGRNSSSARIKRGETLGTNRYATEVCRVDSGQAWDLNVTVTKHEQS